MRAYRWGDDDIYFGPFTFSPKGKSHNPLAFLLTSSGDEDGNNGCALRVGAFGRSLIIALPQIIRPWREKVYPSSWDADTIRRLGRNWYWNVHRREFGWSYSDGFLSVKFGRSTNDSSTDMSRGYFLPWTQWRHIRHSLYGLDGEHFWTDTKGKALGAGWEAYRDAQERCPVVRFAFEDFDGAELTASTMIEEREWRFGTGWFKWLSLLRRPMVHRSLCIKFSDETGPEKGSWKGGASIEMKPGELHEAAFRRYCDEENRSKYRNYRIKFLRVEK